MADTRTLSVEERKNLIEFVTAFASKAVIAAALAVVEACPDSKQRRRCVRRLAKVSAIDCPTDRPACIACSPDEIPYTLQIYLSLVPRGYQTQVDVPSDEYARDLYVKYNIAKDFAVTYWQHVLRNHPDLLVALNAVRPIDWTLTVDTTNPTTLYFDADTPMRAGIFCIWVDAAGKPMMRAQ